MGISILGLGQKGFNYAHDEKLSAEKQRSLHELAADFRQRSLQEVAAYLKSPDIDIQVYAIDGLARFGKESLPLYKELLKNSNDITVKDAVIDSLVTIVEDRVTRELKLNKPDKPDYAFRLDVMTPGEKFREARNSMINFNNLGINNEILPILREVLINDPDEYTKMRAAKVLITLDELGIDGAKQIILEGFNTTYNVKEALSRAYKLEQLCRPE